MLETHVDGHLITYSQKGGYPTFWNGKRNILVHRYIWEKHFGKIPKGYIVHHIDENKNNFAIENLRLMLLEEHNRFHSLKNKLGHSNRGKLKTHSSGFCQGAKAVVLYKDNIELFFRSVTETARFLGVKKISDVSRVLTGKRKTIKGWCCRYR